MKKTISLTLLLTLYSLSTNASNCFLAIENNKILERSGDCKTRHTPCSTFKIALSLMGYNEGFLIDETHPEFPFKREYVSYVEAWKQSQTPTSWIKNSCVWYSQIITEKLGEKKFRAYVKKFNYGNRDISGGLTESWLSSSLEISPDEQVRFLQKLLDSKLPVSVAAHEMTKNILFVGNLPNNWKLYGKTGSCDSAIKNQQTGWFIGWIQKGKRRIIFANYLTDETNLDYSGGKQAKEQAREKMMKLI